MKSNLAKLQTILATFAVLGVSALPAQAALLVSSANDDSIKQYDEITSAYIGDFVTSGSGGLDDPQGLTLAADGYLYVSSSGTNSIKKYSGATGEYIEDFVVPSSGSLYRPNGLTFGSNNNLFVGNTIPSNSSDNLSSAVLEYDGTTGNFIREVVSGIEDPFGSPSPYKDVIFDSNGTLYTTFFGFRSGFGSVDSYDPTTGEPVPGGFQAGPRPFGLAVGPDGDVYASDLNGAVFKAPTDGSTGEFIPYGSGLDFGTKGLTFGPDKNLYVSNSETNSIRKFDGRTGNFLGDFVPSGSGGLSDPTFITFADPVPEPSSVLGILAFAGLFAGGALRRKQVANK